MLNKAKGCAFGVIFGTLLKVIVTILKVLVQILAKVLVFLGLWIPFVYAIFGAVLYFAFDFDPFDFSLYSTLYLSGAIACIFCSLIIGVRNLFIHPTESVFEGYKHPLWEKNRKENIEKEKEEEEKFLSHKERKKLSPPDLDDFKTQKSRPLDDNFLPPKPVRKTPFLNRPNKNIPPDFPNNPHMQPALPNGGNILVNDLENDKLNQGQPINFMENANNFNNFSVEKPSVYFSKLAPELLIHEYSNRFEIYKIVNNTSVLDRIEYK